MFNIECPYCRAIDSGNNVSCTKCGAQYPADAQKVCINCRNRIIGSNTFCGVCGTSIIPQPIQQPMHQPQMMYVQQPIQQQTPQVVNVHVAPQTVAVPTISNKSRAVALILCILLGFWGAHLFYVGKVGRGILYLLTGGLFFVGIIVNFFTILCGYFRDRDGLPLKNW